MYMAYCPNCKQESGHKRCLGFGTLFAVIVTGGLWLIAILFYPARCVICGSSKTTETYPEAAVNLSDNALNLYEEGKISSAECEKILQRKLNLAERPIKDWFKKG